MIPDDSPPLTLRTATTADITEVLDLWTAAGAHPTTTDDAPSLAALLARDGDALLVGELGRAMVGTLIATWDGWRGNMYRLAVRPDVRRRGIAATLVRAGEHRLRALGCRRVTALVLDVDAGAADFWTRVGYEIYPMTRYVRTLAADTPPAVS